MTQHPLNDPFLTDYVDDLRSQTSNELITAEQVDLASLHSIRVFATKWVDNAPPRRLDALILCATCMTPKGAPVEVSEDGVEATFAINYLANFQLLSILSPVLRIQPPDRDVRIILGTCSSYMGGTLPDTVPLPKITKTMTTANSPSAANGKPLSTKAHPHRPIAKDPSHAYGSAKLGLMSFANALQKHLSTYKRPDKQPMNSRVILVDPGWSRTPGMRRYLTAGSLWGLAAYLLTLPMWWLLLKSPEQGAQSFLYAAMEEKFGRGEGGCLVKECRVVQPSAIKKSGIEDEARQKKLWEVSEKAIEALEKEGARKRTEEKREKEEAEKRKERDQEKERKPGSRKSRKAEQQD